MGLGADTQELGAVDEGLKVLLIAIQDLIFFLCLNTEFEYVFLGAVFWETLKAPQEDLL